LEPLKQENARISLIATQLSSISMKAQESAANAAVNAYPAMDQLLRIACLALIANTCTHQTTFSQIMI